MIAWVARWSITSLLLILLVHYIYSFLIDTLTVPKVKDLVHRPAIRYNEMLSDISTQKAPVDEPVQADMQAELKTFLMNMKQNNPQPGPATSDVQGAYSAY